MVQDFNSAINDAILIVEENENYNEIKQLNLSRLQFMLLAQHYGLTTPFVDWSTNPNIALFFSLYNKEKFSDFSPVIYATDPKMINYSSDVSVNNELVYKIFKSDKNEFTEYIIDELKNIEGYNTRNSFVWPVAIESDLDFSHRITFQSGRFTINGPKKPFENVAFKNTQGTNENDELAYLNISAEINIDKKIISELDNYLKQFGYTKDSVLRLGDSKSKLLKELFKEVNERHGSISKGNYS